MSFLYIVTYSLFGSDGRRVIKTVQIETTRMVSRKESIFSALDEDPDYHDLSIGRGTECNIVFFHPCVETLHYGGRHRYVITYSFADMPIDFRTGDLYSDQGPIASLKHLMAILRSKNHIHYKYMKGDEIPIIWLLTEVKNE